MSYYQIIWDKLFFSDSRFDLNWRRVHKSFRESDLIWTYYRNAHSIDEFHSKEFIEFKTRIENIELKIKDCRHKAMAVNYSYSLIESEVKNKLDSNLYDSYSEMIWNKMCTLVEIKSDVLLFEFESFLFQISSNIDISIQLLKYVYPDLNEDKDYDSEMFRWKKGNAGKETIHKMQSSWYIELAKFYQDIVDNWYQELHEMRNIIAHRSNLKWFTNYIYNTETWVIVEPTLQNWKSIITYCEYSYNELLKFYEILLNSFIIPKVSDLRKNLDKK